MSVDEFYTNLYGKVFEKASSALLARYSMQDMSVIDHMENVLMSRSPDSQATKASISTLTQLYSDDVNGENMQVEMQQLRGYLIRKEIKLTTVMEIHDIFSKDQALPILLPNLRNILQMYLTLPSTTCEAERSFSALRRIKSYLRATMTQERLNHVLILNVHEAEAASIPLDQVMNEWIDKAPIRKNTFGKF